MSENVRPTMTHSSLKAIVHFLPFIALISVGNALSLLCFVVFCPVLARGGASTMAAVANAR